MPLNVNEGSICGNLTKDLKKPEGQRPMRFTLAVSEWRKDKETDEWEETVHFIPLQTWSGKELVGKARKGDRLHCSFALNLNQWTDKEGDKHYDLIVNARRVQLVHLSRKHEEEGEDSEPEPNKKSGSRLPF